MKRISFAFNANRMLGFWFFYLFICFTLSSEAYAQQITRPQDPSRQKIEQRLESLRHDFRYRNSLIDEGIKGRGLSARTQRTQALHATAFNYIGQLGGEKLGIDFSSVSCSDNQGNVYVFDWTLDEVFCYNSAGALTQVIPISQNHSLEEHFGNWNLNISWDYDGLARLAVDPAGEYLYVLTRLKGGFPYHSIFKISIATGLFVQEIGNDIFSAYDRYSKPLSLDVGTDGIIYVTHRDVIDKFSSSGNYLGVLDLPFTTDANTYFQNIVIFNDTYFVSDGAWARREGAKVHVFNASDYVPITDITDDYFDIEEIVVDDQQIWFLYKNDPWNYNNKVIKKYEYNLQNEYVNEILQKEVLDYRGLALNRATQELLTSKPQPTDGYGYLSGVHRLDQDGNELDLFHSTNWNEFLAVPHGVYFDSLGNISVGEAWTYSLKKYNSNFELIESKFINTSIMPEADIVDSQGSRYRIEGVNYGHFYIVKYDNLGNMTFKTDIATATAYPPVYNLILDPTEEYIYFIEEFFDASWGQGPGPNTLISSKIKKYATVTGAFVSEVGARGSAYGLYQDLGGIDIDSKGNLFASDMVKKCIHVFDKDGNYLRQIGGPGFEDGEFQYPAVIKIDKKDQLLVLDDVHNDVQVFDINGVWLSKFGGYGTTGENFISSYSMEVGPDNRIYVCDFYGSRVLIFEEESNPLTLISSTQTGRKNRTILYPITTNSFSSVVSTQFTVTWDPTAVTYAGLSSFGLPGMGENSFGIAQVDDGKLVVSWTAPNLAPQTLADNSTLFSINFTLIGTPGTVTPVTIDGSVVPIEIIGSNLTEVEYETVAGSIRIEEPITLIEGTITHHNQPLALVTVDIFRTLWHRPMATDVNGHYSESVTPGFDYTITASKVTDTSAYGRYLNAADLAAMRRHILQVAPFTSPYEKIAADVNESGSISTLDIVLTEAALLGIQPTLPNGGRWKFVPADFVFDAIAPFQHPHSKTVLNVTEDVTQDFVAVHLGDVVNSNAATGRVASKYVLEMTPALTDSELNVVVKGNGFADVSALQAALQWDDSHLDYIGIEGNAISPRVNAVDHTLRLIWDEGNGKSMNFSDGTVLFTLRFRTQTPIHTYETSLTLSKELEAAAFNTYLQSGSISTQWVEDEGHTFNVGVPYPNPSGSSFNLDVTLTAAAEVAFTFIDVQGKTLSSYTQQCEQGLNKILIKTGDTDSKGTGIYLLKIEVGAFSKIVKVVKEK